MLVPPRLPTQKMFLSLVKLLKGGPTTLIDQRRLTVAANGKKITAVPSTALTPAGSFIDRMQEATDRLLYRDTGRPSLQSLIDADRAVEGEIADTPEPPLRAVDLLHFSDDADDDSE